MRSLYDCSIAHRCGLTIKPGVQKGAHLVAEICVALEGICKLALCAHKRCALQATSIKCRKCASACSSAALLQFPCITLATIELQSF